LAASSVAQNEEGAIHLIWGHGSNLLIYVSKIEEVANGVVAEL